MDDETLVRLHVAKRVNVPVEFVAKATAPDGEVGTREVSVTVAVQLVAWPASMVPREQLIETLVGSFPTVTVVDPLLPVWTVSPV